MLLSETGLKLLLLIRSAIAESVLIIIGHCLIITESWLPETSKEK